MELRFFKEFVRELKFPDNSIVYELVPKPAWVCIIKNIVTIQSTPANNCQAGVARKK
jgi:hypothetical protein